MFGLGWAEILVLVIILLLLFCGCSGIISPDALTSFVRLPYGMLH